MLKTDPAAISSTEFFDRSRARLGFDVPPGLIDPNIIPKSGDQGTDRMLEIIAREQPVRPAAVLIPVVDHPQPTILLTQRAAHLNDHAGQISFPGGKMEECDQTPVDCALREAHEEIGLAAEFVETLGFLDSYRTGTGFQISPVVAFVRPGFAVALDPREVLEVFEVPLAFLMDEVNHQKHAREWRGRQRSFYAMPYEGRYIWGATAGMLKNMHQRLFQR